MNDCRLTKEIHRTNGESTIRRRHEVIFLTPVERIQKTCECSEKKKSACMKRLMNVSETREVC